MVALDPFLEPILLFGTTGVMTHAVLARLLAAGIAPAGLVLPGEGRGPPQRSLPRPADPDELPLVDAALQPNAATLAWAQGVPVYTVGRVGTDAVAAWLRDQAPAVAAVACFPRRIPRDLLALPVHGFLNVHPSLLPAYRGPAPLFWQLRSGEAHTGVTVHWMDATLDTGDLARQAAVALPDGATGPELDALLGAAGGDLLVATLAAHAAGTQSRIPQPPGGSYQPWPAAADFRVETAWSARHAFNFLVGTAEWGRPYTLHAAGQTWRIQRALEWAPDAVLPAPVVALPGGRLAVQFRPGVATVLGEVAAGV
jgi:methionyl-tRNA formyltransferase